MLVNLAPTCKDYRTPSPEQILDSVLRFTMAGQPPEEPEERKKERRYQGKRPSHLKTYGFS